MVTIQTFMLCDAVNNVSLPDGRNVPQLVMPVTALRPPIIPGAFSFGLALGVAGVDLKNEHRIKYNIVDPEGEVVHEMENVLPAFEGTEVMPDEYRGYSISIDVRNMVTRTSGEYIFSFWLDDEKIFEKNIPIFEARK